MIDPKIVGDGINEIVAAELGNAAFPGLFVPVDFAEDPTAPHPCCGSGTMWRSVAALTSCRNTHQPAQVDPLRQHRRWQQAGVRHQIRLIEAGGDSAQIMVCSHPSDALSCDGNLVRRKTNSPCRKGICTFTARRQRSSSGGSGLSR